MLKVGAPLWALPRVRNVFKRLISEKNLISDLRSNLDTSKSQEPNGLRFCIGQKFIRGAFVSRCLQIHSKRTLTKRC